MKGKIPLFLRLTLVAILFLASSLFLPVTALAVAPAQSPVLDEGATIASTASGVVVAPSVALMSAAFADIGQQTITITAAPSVTFTDTGQSATTLAATTRIEPVGAFGVFYVVVILLAFTALVTLAFKRRRISSSGGFSPGGFRSGGGHFGGDHTVQRRGGLRFWRLIKPDLTGHVARSQNANPTVTTG